MTYEIVYDEETGRISGFFTAPAYEVGSDDGVIGVAKEDCKEGDTVVLELK